MCWTMRPRRRPRPSPGWRSSSGCPGVEADPTGAAVDGLEHVLGPLVIELLGVPRSGPGSRQRSPSGTPGRSRRPPGSGSRHYRRGRCPAALSGRPATARCHLEHSHLDSRQGKNTTSGVLVAVGGVPVLGCPLQPVPFGMHDRAAMDQDPHVVVVGAHLDQALVEEGS